jgi:hypothetical protein
MAYNNQNLDAITTIINFSLPYQALVASGRSKGINPNILVAINSKSALGISK